MQAVGHNVVGVGAYQEVREQLEVVDLALLPLGQMRQVGGEALAREGHRLDPIREPHGTADPGAFGLEVEAGRGGAHPGELGVDGGAVVALVVVLDQNLPVRSHLVRMAGPDDQLFAVMVLHKLAQVADVLLERAGHRRWRSGTATRATRRRAVARARSLPSRNLPPGRSSVRPGGSRPGRRPTRGTGIGRTCGWRYRPGGSSSWARCRHTL